MKKHLLFVTSGLLLLPWLSRSQDIPLFSQKLTSSFIYNPAMAGHTMGSMTVSYRENYSGVEGAPENVFISAHTPISNHRFGFGANVFQEDVTFIRNFHTSAAFAYHIHINRWNVLSMGIAGEYNTARIDGATNSSLGDSEYQRLDQGKVKNYDFSTGINYQNKFVKFGLSANRLSTAWIKKESDALLSSYYSAYVQGMIPIRNGEDIIEPYIAFRKFSEINDTYDVGLYYTYNKRILAGAALRRGSVANATVGFHLSKYVMIGYSREMLLNNLGSAVGAGNEFTLRFDFNNSEYKERFRADYKAALSYRRKTLSPAGKSPKQLHKKQKKLAPYSPNTRYQNTKKLSHKTKSLPRKKGFNVKKRQKSNFKRKPVKRRR